MAKVVAKGKAKKKRREADKELQEGVGPIQVRQGEDTKPRRNEPSSGEIVQVLADTVEEVYAEFGQRIHRVNADDKARTIVRELRLKHRVRFHDTDDEPKRCKEHAE